MRSSSISMNILVAVIGVVLALHFVFRHEFPVPSEAGGAILISGTSSGIGRATCAWLAEKHPQTTLYCGIRKEVDANSGHPFDLPNVKAVTLDITQQEHVDAVLHEIQSSGKRLIGLVNNAGVAHANVFEFLEMEMFRHVFEVNVMGTFRLTQAALPMIRQSQGRIVIVGSASGLMTPPPMFTAYVSSKFALEAMGDVLRGEMAPLGVSVSLVEPGFLESKITASAKTGTLKVPWELSHQQPESPERRIYPHILNTQYLQRTHDFFSVVGSMQGTCAAIEDALYGKFPKTRYITSRLGPFPSWFTVKVFAFLPDRLADWFYSRLEIMSALVDMRKTIEGLMGIS